MYLGLIKSENSINNEDSFKSFIFQIPSILADVAALIEGIEGGNILSIFSTSLENSGFLIPRSLPATAMVFTEPPVFIQRRNMC